MLQKIFFIFVIIMNNFILRSLSYTLATIGFLLGFTSKVLAQYGAWVASYKYMGQVKSEICNEPLKGIKVKLEDENKNVFSEVYTNETGQYNIRYYADYAVEKLFLTLTDEDGSENKGEFMPLSKAVERNVYKTDEIIMKYKGKVPCIKETELQNEMPVISDSIPAIVSPVINEAVIIQTTVDSAGIQNAKQTPLIPEPIENIIIYPNPNTGKFAISYTLHKKNYISLTVYSDNGQLIYTENFLSESGEHTKPIEMPLLAAGKYILTIKTNEKVYTRNIIILN